MPRKAQAAVDDDRAPLDYLEPVADDLIARALKSGADLYGYRDFTKEKVKLRTYLAAIKRHVNAVRDGEDLDQSSGLPHVAHIGANTHIILAAAAAGTLIDDRAAEVKR